MSSLKVEKNKVKVIYEQDGEAKTTVFDKVLLSVGRKPQSYGFKAEKVNLAIDQRGFIQVNERMQTNLEHIFAIGDVVGNPM